MSRVLGTEVFALARELPRALLISDLHLPDGGSTLLGPLRSALAAALRRDAALLVLGDLFDSYVSRAQIRHGVWAEVAALFAAATRAGTHVEVLVGNRDFLLGPEFAARSRVRVVAGGLRGRIGGVDTLLLHGDELCQHDLPYQRAKRWLRLPVTRWLARRLPLSLALGVAERARRRSRKVVASGDQSRFLPTRQALLAAFQAGAERLVFGHIHRHAQGHEAGSYWVLPAFDATATGLFVGAAGVESVHFDGADGQWSTVPAPGPLPPLP